MSQHFLNCLVRKIQVVSTPEEVVRQSLLRYMIEDLEYPLENLAVEKELASMPHLSLEANSTAQRRADIVCFAKEIHHNYSLYPLLLIECKSVKLDRKVRSQVIGYNRFLKAFYIAMANREEVQIGWYDPSSSEYQFVEGLPSFSKLIKNLNSKNAAKNAL